ncbi:MAG: anti-sigma factor domain-containing protein [Vulcanimicrobiaceae bacterium]
MIQHDEKFHDQLAMFALGALPAVESGALARHVAGCPECRAEYARLRATADLIAYAAEPEPGELLGSEDAARLKARVMYNVRNLRNTRIERSEKLPRPAAARPMPSADGVLPRVVANWPAFAALAAAVVLVLGTLGLFGLHAKSDGQRIAQLEQQVATLEQQANTPPIGAQLAQARASRLERFLKAFLAKGSRRFAVKNGEVVTSHGRVLIALRVPPPPAGKTYQAWTLKSGATKVAPSLTFRPDAGGIALVELPESAKGLAAIAVSVEPEGGSKVPTSAPIIIRKLS